MKTSLRIFTMSFVALVAFTFASKTFASWNAYIIFTDKDGKDSKVALAKDGSFTSSELKAGRVKVQFFWDRSSSSDAKSGTLTVSATPGGTAQAAGKSGPFTVTNTGDAPTGSQRESSPPSVSEITMTYVMEATSDAKGGMGAGKVTFNPFSITRKVDKSSPTIASRETPSLSMNFGKIEVRYDNDKLSGKITIKDQNGKTMAMDDWHQ